MLPGVHGQSGIMLLFMLIPVVIPVVIAAYSIVGEKTTAALNLCWLHRSPQLNF